MEYYLAIKGMKVLISVATGIKLKKYYAQWKKSDTKEHILYDSLCERC